MEPSATAVTPLLPAARKREDGESSPRVLPPPPHRHHRSSPLSLPFVLFLLSLLSLLSPSSLLVPVLGGKAAGGGGGKALYCALCEVVVDEVSAAIARVASEHAHVVQTKWRIDEKRHIPYARTEAVVMEIIEEQVAPSLPLYGASNHTGRTRLLRKFDAPSLATAPLLPPLSAADEEGEQGEQVLDDAYAPSAFNHTAGLTSSLSALYERMVDSHLEDMMLLFHRDEPDIKAKLCVHTVRACKKGTSFEPFHPPQRARKPPTSSSPTSPQPSSPPPSPPASSPPSPSTPPAALDDSAVHSQGHGEL